MPITRGEWELNLVKVYNKTKVPNELSISILYFDHKNRQLSEPLKFTIIK